MRDYFTFSSILEKSKEAFSEHIIKDISSFFYWPKEHSGFAGLDLVSREYALQKYLDPRIETYIREFLAKDVLCKSCESKGSPCNRAPSSFELAPNNPFISNQAYEEQTGFEFIMLYKSKRIAVRFTSVESSAIQALGRNDIAEIIVIEWYGNTPRDSIKNYSSIPVTTLSIRDFVEYYIGSQEATDYELFLNSTIEELRATIGISSIPKLTAPLLFEFRLDKERFWIAKAQDYYHYYRFENEERKKPSKQQKTTAYAYKVIDAKTKKDQKYRTIEEDSKKILMDPSMLDTYLEHQYYKALFGKKDFARSFLTSEYLYEQFDENDLFDYTAIVSGYLKSIEQLLYCIATCHVDKGYKIGPKYKKVELTKEIVKSGELNITLGNLCFFLKENRSIFKSPDEKVQDTILNCLDCFCDECRNGSFHRHNNYNWNKVRTIRSNVSLLYIFLLCGCKLKDTEHESQEELGIIKNDQLERIYYWLRENNIQELMILQQYGQSPVRAVRCPERVFPRYNKNGLLQNMVLYFECPDVLDSHGRPSSLQITKDSIPVAIWYNSCGEDIQLDYEG